MERYRKSLIILLIADIAFIIFLFVFYLSYKENNTKLQYDNAKFVFEDMTDKKVIPSGEPMGIYMKTDGVMVVDTGDIVNEEGQVVCPSQHNLQAGDYITEINGRTVNNKNELISCIESSGGLELNITYVRNEEKRQINITPVMSDTGKYKLGLWVKDDIAGIGTVTFIYENSFMALGHSVSDNDTGQMIRCATGGMYTTDITKINKSYNSMPGQLQGSIVYTRDLIGIINKNTENGIIGNLDKDYVNEHYNVNDALYIAKGNDVETGKAYIYSRLTGELVKYEINIEKVNYNANNKNIEFEVTDQELINLTGGVVQGMSGSPIIQNDKIIGAVTHVFVDNPRKGYGVFVENMLEN
ncbi:MAG: SpoIVB peptidase [Coprococcus sp.]